MVPKPVSFTSGFDWTITLNQFFNVFDLISEPRKYMGGSIRNIKNYKIFDYMPLTVCKYSSNIYITNSSHPFPVYEPTGRTEILHFPHNFPLDSKVVTSHFTTPLSSCEWSNTQYGHLRYKSKSYRRSCNNE